MISVETARTEIVDVIETIEKWIPMFEQGNSPAVLEDVMDLLSSQHAEIERLKEQQVRLLTYDELFHEETFCVWYEEWGVQNVFQVACVDGEYEDMNVHYAIEDNEENRAEYGKAWRMWTLKPTEEQRQEVKWE